MFDVAKVLSDKGFVIRMNSILCASDAVANNVRHVGLKRRGRPKPI